MEFLLGAAVFMVGVIVGAAISSVRTVKTDHKVTMLGGGGGAGGSGPGQI